MTQKYVVVEKHEGILTLRLNDPARLNPLSVGMQQELLHALEEVRSDPFLRVLVMTGTGKSFCVGADLGSVEVAIPQASGATGVGERVAQLMQELTNPLIMAVRSMPVPVLTVLQGPAAGAGVGLALAADIVVASPGAYFYLPFMPALGLVPDVGTSWFLPRMVSRARAMGLTLLGSRMSGAEAATAGLIWACLQEDCLAEEVGRISAQLAALPAGAAPELRKLFDESAVHTLAEQLDYERRRQCELVDRPPFAEGLQAFKEKRRPDFHRTLNA
jgi:2-(1,2-epoxy-1,2-dihydrophenyl)acetyl-CoA isomerase